MYGDVFLIRQPPIARHVDACLRWKVSRSTWANSMTIIRNFENQPYEYIEWFRIRDIILRI